MGSKSEPIFTLVNKIVYDLGGKFWMVQLVCAAIVNVLIFRYFEQHTKYVFSCILVYFIWVFSDFNAEEMRAGVAYVICLLKFPTPNFTVFQSSNEC